MDQHKEPEALRRQRFISACGRRARAWAGLALIAALALTGCRRDRSASQATGPRIASLAPNLTEMLGAIGADDCLVGRSSACSRPAAAVTRASIVGDFGVPSLEALVAVQPDWVVGVALQDRAMADAMTRMGLRWRLIPCATLDDIPAALRTLGELTGRVGEAGRVAAGIEAGLAEQRARPPPSRRPRVYVEIWGDPPMSAGRGAFIADLVGLAGGVNIFDDVERDYFQVTDESVIGRDPDVMLLLQAPDRATARRLVGARPGWAALRALRDNQVYGGLDPDLLQQPGPRVLDAIVLLRACLAQAAGAGSAAP